MVFLWLSSGFPMVFLWFSYGQTLAEAAADLTTYRESVHQSSMVMISGGQHHRCSDGQRLLLGNVASTPDEGKPAPHPAEARRCCTAHCTGATAWAASGRRPADRRRSGGLQPACASSSSSPSSSSSSTPFAAGAVRASGGSPTSACHFGRSSSRRLSVSHPRHPASASSS
jgi:hypothetical protein